LRRVWSRENVLRRTHRHDQPSSQQGSVWLVADLGTASSIPFALFTVYIHIYIYTQSSMTAAPAQFE